MEGHVVGGGGSSFSNSGPHLEEWIEQDELDEAVVSPPFFSFFL